MIPKIPKNMAQQTVTLKVPTGEIDEWGHQEFEEVIINNCVVQPQTIYSGTNNDRQIVANAIVFFYSGITTPLPVLKHDAVNNYKLIFEEVEYTITNIVDNRNPYSNDVYSYELEML